MPTFGSLFAGIGGIDLGLERAGWTGRWQVEWDAYCQRVLAKHWPDVPRYGDITAVDWSGVERVDLLAGGFPCQPVSTAGKRLAQADARWLWPEFERAIRELRPRLVLVENVPGLLTRGMGDVLGGLASLGYDAEWDVVSAADVGAPHLRRRVWITAVADADRAGQWFDSPRHPREGEPSGRPSLARSAARSSGEGGAPLADASGTRQPRSGQPFEPGYPAPSGDGQAVDALDGRLGNQWSAEPDVGRVAHGVPNRVDRLRALGNAVVPQVVEVIGRQLMEKLS